MYASRILRLINFLRPRRISIRISNSYIFLYFRATNDKIFLCEVAFRAATNQNQRDWCCAIQAHPRTKFDCVGNVQVTLLLRVYTHTNNNVAITCNLAAQLGQLIRTSCSFGNNFRV